ncbi:uncharacterized protein LOC135316641 isoform X3 [Phalacrocorax carbo]|uniref:uncharacterized protein LOC135316641 isoform X3 n=1 Tax=Phalacrocorax carbo TaxID=9209 RepID=UPI00311A7CA5
MGELSLQEDAGICSSYAGLDLPTQGRARGADLVSLSSRTLLFSSYSAVTETTRLEEGKKKEKIKLMSRWIQGSSCHSGRLSSRAAGAARGSPSPPCTTEGRGAGMLCWSEAPVEQRERKKVFPATWPLPHSSRTLDLPGWTPVEAKTAAYCLWADHLP